MSNLNSKSEQTYVEEIILHHDDTDEGNNHSSMNRTDMVNVSATSEGVISTISTTYSAACPLVASVNNMKKFSKTS